QLAARVGLVEHRQIADHQSEKSNSQPGFDHQEELRGGIQWFDRRHCKEGSSAEIHSVQKRRFAAGNVQAYGPLKKGKRQNDTDSPAGDQANNRERSKDSNKSFAEPAGADLAGDPRVRSPGESIKERCEA